MYLPRHVSEGTCSSEVSCFCTCNLHVLVLARITVIVQESICVGWFHHLHQNWCQLSFQSKQTLCKCCSCHLDTTFIWCIYLEVMAECRMKAKKAQTLCASILTCTSHIQWICHNNWRQIKWWIYRNPCHERCKNSAMCWSSQWNNVSEIFHPFNVSLTPPILKSKGKGKVPYTVICVFMRAFISTSPVWSKLVNLYLTRNYSKITGATAWFQAGNDSADFNIYTSSGRSLC